MKAGLSGNPPVINIRPKPMDTKREGEFYVNDIKSTIALLNLQVLKAAKVGIKINFDLLDEDGVVKIALHGATRE
jgi:hypothetical protein